MSVETSKTIRVLRSGQIYRQMFDAQLQLNRSLSHYDSKSCIKRLRSRELSQPQKVPLIRLDQEETQHGILTSQQKTWVGGFPNDPYTENPVLYKQFGDYISHRSHSFEIASQAGQDVRNLPDVVVPGKKGSDIVDRITESRRQRHESAVEDMHQELSLISIAMEAQIEEISAMLLKKLTKDDEDIERIIDCIRKDQKLLQYGQVDLYSIWEEIQSHSFVRQRWIQEMDANLKKVESDRVNKIREVFTKYGEKLYVISYLMQPDLQRFLDKESQMINQAVLSNNRCYADLFVRLMSADIEREKTQRNICHRRVDDWKAHHTKLVIESFKDFMMTEEVVKPMSVEIALSRLLSDLDTFNSQQLDGIKTLCDMQPPNSTKFAVRQWRQDIQKLTMDLDVSLQTHLRQIYQEYETVCKQCLERAESTKDYLIEAGMCSEHRARRVLDEFILPYIGQQQRIFENRLETIEKVLEEQTSRKEEVLADLFQFAQGAADVWDAHETGLASKEKELQEKLEESRHIHDQENQEKEANLDMMIDKMRQDASEMALKDSLIKVLTQLETIRQFYEDFHSAQINIVNSYPSMVKQELDSFDEAVCHFFYVRRQPVCPEDLETHGGGSEDEEGVKDEPEGNEEKEHAADDVEDNEENQSATMETANNPPVGSNCIIKEILQTSRGIQFYVFVKAESVEDKEAVLGELEEDEKQNEEKEEPSHEKDNLTSKLIMSMDIPASLIAQVKRAICMNFLEQIDDWCEKALERVNSIIVAKSEELNNELDLRLHLHQPRPGRVQLDIHNVRAAELVMHAERVTRHCNGMNNSLAELTTKFKTMSQDHNELANKFRADIQGLQVIYLNATKSVHLVKLQSQVSVLLDKYMTVLCTSLRQFRQYLDDTLQTLRQSNAQFLKSFRLFSDGGNFCPEEIDEYRKKLDKMSQMIDSTEGSIMSELEGMETKYLAAATKVTVEFEDRFKGHMCDLVFMEQLASWLTNIQVKIKAEVARSNIQAQKLVQMLKDFECIIDAYERPDKEPITAAQLNENLVAIFEACVSRSAHLHCIKTVGAATVPDSGTRIGFTTGVPLATNKAGRITEDASVGVIKSLLNKQKSLSKERTQRNKMRCKLDLDQDRPVANNVDSTNERNKSALSFTSMKVRDNNKNNTRRFPIGVDQNLRRPQSSARQNRNQSKLGEEKPEDATKKDMEDNHFLALVQQILREAQGGLQPIAEDFYANKGSRPVTRPEALQETLDQCVDSISQKLQSYYQQADQYQNQCLLEFRGQLSKLEQLCARVPALVFKDLLREEVQKLQDAQRDLSSKLQSLLEQLNTRQKSHQNKLQPILGHPSQEKNLITLCEEEAERHQDYMSAVMAHVQESQECALQCAKLFLERLVSVAEFHLLQFDGTMLTEEVEKGRMSAKRYPTCKLIRRLNAGVPLEDEEDKDVVPKGKANWIGFPSNLLVIGAQPESLQMTPTVVTQKNTLAHTATVTARDKAYEDYKKYFEECLQQTERKRERLLLSESRWEEFWESSVDKVKSLYNTED